MRCMDFSHHAGCKLRDLPSCSPPLWPLEEAFWIVKTLLQHGVAWMGRTRLQSPPQNVRGRTPTVHSTFGQEPFPSAARVVRESRLRHRKGAAGEDS